jgi:hypothetical protein
VKQFQTTFGGDNWQAEFGEWRKKQEAEAKRDDEGEDWGDEDGEDDD